MSYIRVLLPLPGHAGNTAEQTQGKVDVDALAQVVLAGAGDAMTLPLPGRRASGVGMRLRPLRYAPVRDASLAMTSDTSPVATMWPPCSPAPGPRSTMWSAARIMASSCSTTMTVLPMSRRRVRVPMRRWSSWGCRPTVGSSQTYSTPVRPAADLGGQADPLGLAAGESAGGAVHGHVVQADAIKELEAALDLLEYLVRDDHFALGEGGGLVD